MPISAFLVNGCVAGLLCQLPQSSPAPVTISCQTTAELECRHQQAGWPLCVAWWAIPSDSCGYYINRVGGGCPCPRLADPPLPHEGTWGWDYVGHWLPHNVLLGWWHGLCQGGTGAYQTDGPSTNHGEGTLRSLHDR